MTAMRAITLAAAALLVVSGCGGAATTGTRGEDAARLVPPDSVAFLSVDTNLDSEQWKLVRRLAPDFQVGLTRDYERELRPALGDELNLAILDVDDGEPEAIALVHSDDEAKLRALASTFDRDGERYTVQRIGGWSVVADSPEAFDAVRRAESGRSLADTAGFQTAMAADDGDALATAYANGSGLEQVPDEIGALFRVVGSPRWIAARLAAEDDAARLELQAASPDLASRIYRPRLLREVPSGALVAVSFRDAHLLLNRLAAEPALLDSLREVQQTIGVSLVDLAAALRGEGVFYVVPSTLIPILVFAVESPNPRSASRALERVAARIRAKTRGALALHVVTKGNRVVLTNGLGSAPNTGGRLVDDQRFKDALAAADVPDQVTWLAYADLQRLAPIVQALSQLLGNSAQPDKLERLGTLVAFGARSGSVSRLQARVTIR